MNESAIRFIQSFIDSWPFIGYKNIENTFIRTFVRTKKLEDRNEKNCHNLACCCTCTQ